MATYHLQVSSHAKVVVGRSKYALGENISFKSYVAAGKILEWAASVTIYGHLTSGDTATSKVVNVVFGGNSVEDYALWDLKTAPYKSGVLNQNTLVVDIAGSTEVNPVYLSAAMTSAIQKLGIKSTDEINIYFNACRA